MPAATASLQTLNSKLVKSRHCLHTVNLKCDSIKTECERARQQVQDNDASLSALAEEEQALKRAYVEQKLAYERSHADKYAKQQQLKQMRARKVTVTKERDAAANALASRRCDWIKAHEQHKRVDAGAQQLSAKLEVVEKAKEECRRKSQQHKDEVTKYSALYDELKRELDVIHASAAAVV
mmetsp:Transcript_24216/g.52231  ORF Transcript_24216/g.52231 Transcript_24216/m.52231 type:complete len:181 (-) Transcript_24216:192-734(-)|eukprot:CAMPEP_0183354692 /NCGR_PEP_ID=MMETSP0164_2-20130417/37819_1 /TAXON_ID=221442 /ORGANISM="Coccolithus pelagicus ssp braarudi, Strain PLY182g" /LENGTH=180 /DNA_ID=CAMNT_0025527629 /DNA_START=167 /DNA_END=709 /DNA_ORIENTATION=+